ncbi:MAG: hypothetical protein LAC70_01415 [Methylovulum sp.]|nr:hypothetical protein [Methylovulum sp.]
MTFTFHSSSKQCCSLHVIVTHCNALNERGLGDYVNTRRDLSRLYNIDSFLTDTAARFFAPI